PRLLHHDPDRRDRGRHRPRAIGGGHRRRLRSGAGAGRDRGEGLRVARRTRRLAHGGQTRGSDAVILVIDHYDSFVYNLVQLVEGLGYETEVVRSDAETAPALLARRPDAVILSPGP